MIKHVKERKRRSRRTKKRGRMEGEDKKEGEKEEEDIMVFTCAWPNMYIYDSRIKTLGPGCFSRRGLLRLEHMT